MTGERGGKHEQIFLVVTWPERFQHIDLRPIVDTTIKAGITVRVQYEDGFIAEGSIAEAREVTELQRPHVRVYDLDETERLLDLVSERPILEHMIRLAKIMQARQDNPLPGMSEEEAKNVQKAIHAGG